MHACNGKKYFHEVKCGIYFSIPGGDSLIIIICLTFSLYIGVNDLTTSPADYSLLTTAVTFTSSDVSNTKSVQLLITNDQIVEPSESLALTLNATDASVNTTSAVISILDDDSKCVHVTQRSTPTTCFL